MGTEAQYVNKQSSRKLKTWPWSTPPVTDLANFELISNIGFKLLQLRISLRETEAHSRYDLKLWTEKRGQVPQKTKYGLPQSFEIYFDKLVYISKHYPVLQKTVLNLLDRMAGFHWPHVISYTMPAVIKDLKTEIQ
jgi:hypothetical protein